MKKGGSRSEADWERERETESNMDTIHAYFKFLKKPYIQNFVIWLWDLISL